MSQSDIIAAVVDYMICKPIATKEDAEVFIRALYLGGKLFHFDDSPETILKGSSNELLFSCKECAHLRRRVDEMFGIDGFDPFELAVALIDEE